MVNTFTFGGNRDESQDDPEVDGNLPPSGAQVVTDLGITGVNPKGYSSPGGFPVMDITGIGILRVQPGGDTIARSLTFADALSWSKGRHVIKFGGEVRTYRNFAGVVPEIAYGSFNFDGSLTGNGYSDFLLGLPFTSVRLDPFVNRVTRSKELGLYITDTFKLSQRLTVDFGLRWDYFPSADYADGLEYNWDPKTGNVVVPESARAKVSPLYPVNTIKLVTGDVLPHAEKTNFAPRLAPPLIASAIRLWSAAVMGSSTSSWAASRGRRATVHSRSRRHLPTACRAASRYFSSPTRSQPARAVSHRRVSQGIRSTRKTAGSSSSTSLWSSRLRISGSGSPTSDRAITT